MLLRVDTRETELITTIQKHISITPSFSDIQLRIETLPIGDIIITQPNETTQQNEDLVIIERKTVADLLSSIKDGRYEEQSYRLNGLNHHNHNIIYLVEGTLNRKSGAAAIENKILYSAIFSLNYYKGFSVFRSFNIDETAMILCNMILKLTKEMSKKSAFYKLDSSLQPQDQLPPPTEKDYVSVVKKIKKDNITPGNIGEIILCQIPGISSITALAIMEKYKTIGNLMKELNKNNQCLNGCSYTNNKGQVRKINKSSIDNIIKFLVDNSSNNAMQSSIECEVKEECEEEEET
jgi:ERCC4-type nuclease